MPKTDWRKLIFTRSMLSIFFLGISSGLPFHLTRDTMKAWLVEEKLDLATIGFFSLVALPYNFKFVWSPFLDRYVPPFLGRRRGWILVSQLLLALAIAGMAFTQPHISLTTFAVLAFLVAFCAATQDIAVDAYRRDVLEDSQLGFGSAMAVNGYRVGMLYIGSALALTLAEYYSWQTVYLLIAVCMAANTIFTFTSPNPPLADNPPQSLQAAVIDPLKDFFSRKGAWLILLFVLLYKIGDAMASTQFMPFYLLKGYTNPEIAAIAKFFGLLATILGVMIGGVFIVKLGYYWSLWIFGILQALSTWGFSWLSIAPNSQPLLAFIITFENLTSGMGTAAYAGFMAMACNKRFSATQYALLSSLMGVPLVFLGGPGGWLATRIGWYSYFTFCTLLAAPGLLLVFFFHKQLLGEENQIKK